MVMQLKWLVCTIFVTCVLVRTSCADFDHEDEALFSYGEDEQGAAFNVTLHPSRVEGLIVDTTAVVNVNYTCSSTQPRNLTLHAIIADTYLAEVVENARIPIVCRDTNDSYVNSTHIKMKGKFLGRTTMRLRLVDADDKRGQGVDVMSGYSVSVVRRKDIVNSIFVGTIIVFIIILNVGFGCSVDLDVVKEILKTPIPPAIGFACQYVLMPLLAFGISQAFQMKKVFGFGLLVVGTCPGGGGSNVWTVLLNGDLNLSLTMTLISKIMALLMMPFWLFALGRFYMDFNKIKIPYANIVTGLIAIVVPCALGILIRKFKPGAAHFIIKTIRPLSYAFIIFVIGFGSLSNIFIYILMGRHWYIVPAALGLPYLGFLLGYIFSLILRQPKYRALTISIETGIQDTGIAIVLLQSSFPMPEGDQASSLAMAAALFMPFPLIFIRTAMTIYNLCWLKGKCVKCGGPMGVEISDQEKKSDSVEDQCGGEKYTLQKYSPKELANGSA